MTLPAAPSGAPPSLGGRRVPSPLEGLLLLLVSALLFWGGALLIMSRDGVLAYAILPAAAFLLPSVAWAEIRGTAGLAFPSRMPRFGDLAASASLLAGASLLALAFAGALSGTPGSSGEEEALRSLVLGVPAPTRLLLFAVLPALCEEMLFRGSLLACLHRWGKWRAVLASGLVFALFHGSLVRFGPVAILGLALALVVWETGNLWVAVAGHAAHNSLILLALSSGVSGGPPSPASLALLALSGAALVGIWFWGRSRGPGRSPSEAGSLGSERRACASEEAGRAESLPGDPL